MATSFKGWLNSWLNSWGAGTVDPNAVLGTATIALSATGQIGAAGWINGSATVTVGTSGVISGVGNTPLWRVIWVGSDARGSQVSAEMRISYA